MFSLFLVDTCVGYSKPVAEATTTIGADEVITLRILIRPEFLPIQDKRNETIPIALLSTRELLTPVDIDVTSLTFGRTGDEQSLAYCLSGRGPGGGDEDDDGIPDLVCHFNLQKARFNPRDAFGILKGKTTRNVPTLGFGKIKLGEPMPVLPQTHMDGFDRVLFISNGSNTSQVFEAGDFFQGIFRLAGSVGGENIVSDWNTFMSSVISLQNAADSIHGVPLMIAKSTFVAPPSAPQIFFMAAFAVKTIHQEITILSSPAFQLSDDPVDRIQLQVEGRTIDVGPVRDTGLQFASKGPKTIRAIVRFASGFVGETLFSVVVE